MPFAGASIGVAISSVWTDGVGPDHVLHVGSVDVGSSKIRVGEVGLLQIRVGQIGRGEIGVGQVRIRQVGVAEVAIFQISPGEVGALKIAAGEGRIAPEVRDGLPQHWMKVAVNVETRTDDLAARVYGNGIAAADAAKRGELDHPAGRRPREGTRITSAKTRADDLATVVHGHGLAEVKSFVEDTEIDHSTGRRP